MTTSRQAPAEQHGRWTGLEWSRLVHDRVVLGRRLRYVDLGEGDRLPLLLVHGLGGCWQWWLECLPELAANRRVIAVDLPGFGGSEPLPGPAEMATHADTMVALLDLLGIDEAVVCAHSMGGLVALQMAASASERVAGLVLVCAGGIHLGPLRLALITRGFAAFHAAFARAGMRRAFTLRPRLRRMLFAPALGDSDTLRPELGVILVPALAAPGFIDALRAGIRVANELEPAAIAVPTLLIWGDRDPILPVAGARELVGRIPGARLVVLEGVGHCPMIERPVQFSELLSGFGD